ncbi:MAG: type II toxin-antitoxin system VapC family toxin [Sulfuricellaceae bacterium]|nr:type II toxin-antitoxin system VapC family toxin [Sulfuricellaceae bacterium]
MNQRVLLDTNVLSELMRRQPDAKVLTWFEQHTDTACVISAITRAEVLLGIALLPEGKRRDDLANAAELMFQEEFAGRCAPFDENATDEYAALVAARTRIGRPISTEDAQIAAIALTNRLPLATRNVKDFSHIAGLTLMSPWD